MLVSWCFKPSQTQRILSGLKETFIKKYIVERTNKADMRLEEQREKAESCRENSWNEIQLKGPKRKKQTQEQNKKRSRQAWLAYVKNHKPQHPHHVKVSPRGSLSQHRQTSTSPSDSVLSYVACGILIRHSVLSKSVCSHNNCIGPNSL